MNPAKITFVLFTYNEVSRIEKVIKNFQAFGKILLADNNSNDGTIELAKKNGCDVFLRKEEYVFVENQKLVDQLYEVITTDWIYWAFADEMIDLNTLIEIEKIVDSNLYDIISMDRKNYFYGEFCYDLFHARTYKLFKKHKIDFTDNVIHSMGKATVTIDRIYDLPDKYFVHHFISNTASSYLNTINHYTDAEINSKNLEKVNTSVLYFIFSVFKILFKSLLLQKGFKARFSGLALSELMLFYSLIKNMKVVEELNTLNRSGIEEKNNEFRKAILKNFI